MPAGVTRVRIPVRVPTSLRAIVPVGVDVMTGGIGRGRTDVREAWAVIDLELADAVPPTRFKRVDLRMDRAWQPALYIPGNADLRSVGVQVGECEMLRGR